MDYPDLVRFFGAHKVAEIQRVPNYVAYCASHASDLRFRAERDKTEMAKKAIEGRLDTHPPGRDQVRRALELLESQRYLDFDRHYELIAVGYKPAWSQTQQSYFEHAVRIIRSGNYFFLSFTGRGPESLGDKAVNRRYWHFIRRTIRKATSSDRKDRNLLADAIDTALRDESIEGFYYKRHDNDNSVVERKLREACGSCLVFLQLVDNAMFMPPKDPNYCEFEYRQALEFIRQIGGLDETRVVFVVAAKEPENLPDPDRVHAPYSDWVKHIRTKSAVYLPPVPDYDAGAIAEIKAKVATVVNQVRVAKNNLLNRIPG